MKDTTWPAAWVKPGTIAKWVAKIDGAPPQTYSVYIVGVEDGVIKTLLRFAGGAEFPRDFPTTGKVGDHFEKRIDRWMTWELHAADSDEVKRIRAHLEGK